MRWRKDMIFIYHICRADELARHGTTIELTNEFSTLGVPLKTCKLIIDNATADSVDDRWAAPGIGRTAQKIWPRLDRERTSSLLKFQRSTLSMVIEVITGHCIIGTYARHIGLGRLANDVETARIKKRRKLSFTYWVHVQHYVTGDEDILVPTT